MADRRVKRGAARADLGIIQTHVGKTKLQVNILVFVQILKNCVWVKYV